MMVPIPDNESERLNALYEYGILDTAREAEIDDLARLAAYICGKPIAAVTLIDAKRLWFKSIIGLNLTEMHRDIAFCAHTILQPDLMIVPDARADSRFSGNKLVTGDPNIRFYAGMPLISANGFAVGTLCVIDRVVRNLTPEQADALRTLARQVSRQMEAARALKERERLVAEKEQLTAERERAEAALDRSCVALAESKERLRRLTDVAFEGIAISENAILVDVSPAFAALFGYSDPEEMIGMLSTELAAPESREAVAQAIADRDERPYEATMIRRDGTAFLAEIRGRAIHTDDRAARVTAIRDISEQRAMERTLRERAEHLRRLTDAAFEGIIITQGRTILDVSPACATLFGYASPEEMAVLSGSDIVAPESREVVINAVEAGEIRPYEALLLRRDGTTFHAELRGREIHIDGKPSRITAVRDISEYRAAEAKIRDYAALLESQKNELEKANALLEALAITDGLTNLRNHRAFQERLAAAIAQARRDETPMSLVILDVDNFKRFNDEHGHPAGDDVLRTLAEILTRTLPDSDLVARYGGEEFVVILPDTDAAAAAVHAEGMRAAIEAHVWPLLPITASFGVAALCPEDGGNTDIMSRADRALYRSKASGRNRVTVSEG